MNENVVRTLVIGAVGMAVLSAALLLPAVAGTARPLLRRGMKTAIKAYAQGREALAEVQEIAEDAYAEAWAELKAEAQGPDAATAAAGGASASAPTAEETPPKRTRRKRASA